MDKKYTYVIVGGGPASRILNRYLRLYVPSATTILLRDEERIVNHCGTPYIVEGIIPWKKGLIKEEIVTNFDTEIIVDKVIGGDPEKKYVLTESGKRFYYEKLIFATGTDQVIPPIKGSDLEGILKVRKTKDLLVSIDFLNSVKDVVVLGGGYIGVEFAQSLKNMGKNVTIVELLPHIFGNNYDEKFTEKLEEEIENLGINLITGKKAVEFTGKGRVEGVLLDDGSIIKADAVLSAVGVKPNIEYADSFGLEYNRNGLIVDEFFRTNVKDIYAIGDCIDTISFITKKSVPGKLGSNAGMMARILGLQQAGLDIKYEGVINVVVTKVGNLYFGAAGLTEKNCDSFGIEYEKAEATSTTIYANMPHVKDVYVKILYEKGSLKIIGGELLGYTNIAGFVEVLGEMIRHGENIFDVVTMHYSSHPEMTPKTSHPYFAFCSEKILKKIIEDRR